MITVGPECLIYSVRYMTADQRQSRTGQQLGVLFSMATCCRRSTADVSLSMLYFTGNHFVQTCAPVYNCFLVNSDPSMKTNQYHQFKTHHTHGATAQTCNVLFKCTLMNICESWKKDSSSVAPLQVFCNSSIYDQDILYHMFTIVKWSQIC